MSLLRPGSHRVAALVDDAAVAAALLAVEAAWSRALGRPGARADPALSGLLAESEDAGNPVVPLVRALRASVDDPAAAALIHRGLTSQDVLDSALMLLAARVLDRVRDDLAGTAGALAGHARRHRDHVMAGRTLTQHAVPITFGLKAAQWLTGVLDALDTVAATRAALPAQCGGAAGTLSLLAATVPDPLATAAAFAAELGLADPGLPWHTRRTPVTRLGDTLVTVTDALGVIAAGVALLARPEFGELAEGGPDGRGGSSTMPHKHNPVLSVLIRGAAAQAPLLAAQLHLAAAQAVDERPDGAWHSEWPALQALLLVTATAASQAAELTRELRVHPDVMARRAHAAAADLLAERGGAADADVEGYLGVAGTLVDRALARHADHPAAGSLPAGGRAGADDDR
ncbi:3-carboxy-cis,cis-muconate cycloisomerase [Dactylosporangium aurantiacum]|uniref:3-carboxy-cis,cis-muconate cycloisomerase n=1 Tax=Dactylosporangium aurantiacum TaxID=35754 RepID=A0A9Q9IC16_9ACTN|nr:lyase family protein [Dactylosporangium aurantiacum]MDG6107235.1 lyase family protein [Dactylosporangium aurantiacum]UWZ51232.1 3-carboxy-cis,cis-muconate cycloisomerase [Dactylosporangium aurantiacum]